VSLVVVSGPKPLQSVRGEFEEREIPLTPRPGDGTFQGLIGIDMNKNPGDYTLEVIAETTDRKLLVNAVTLTVEKVNFATQRLTLPRSMVDLDPKTLERVNKESTRLKTLFKGIREERLWQDTFIRPVDGEVTTPFGVRRFLNDQPRNPHSGVDLRAPEGAPVRACNDGVVLLVDEMFFTGKSVVLDHGWGIYSMYFHLSEARVREGETISGGNIVGLAGSTGRASGPHLHWGIRLNGARVDPLSLIGLNEYFEE
jgi:murein DD-endopeptidase MepM/ murein hydrolase activator NlpD